MSQEGYLLVEHSWYGCHVDEMWILRRLPKPDRIKGVCLSLASDFATGNYGHFLLDCLGRLDLFFRAGFSLADVDHIYCPVPNSSGAMRLLERLGVPLKKCIWACECRSLQPDVLLATSFPGTRRNYPTWLVEFLRRSFVTTTTPPDRRLYIPRGGHQRRLVNEPELIDQLQQHGFEYYDYTQHPDEPNYFATAAIVVGAHGAGLTNLAFCQPGGRVLELIPSDHVFPYYYTLADSAGLDYGYLVGASLGTRDSADWGPSPYDFRVDPAEFEQALTQMTQTA